QLFCFLRLGKHLADVIDVFARHSRQQFGRQQGPDRRQRSSRDLPAVGALGRSIDQYGLKRLEKQARRPARAVRPPPAFRTQRCDQLFRAGYRLAELKQPLEFGKQPAANLRRELPQILLELVTCAIWLSHLMATPGPWARNALLNGIE